MNIRNITSGLLLLAILFTGLVSFTNAADPNSTEITGLQIVKGENYVSLSWDALTDNTKRSYIQGYAVTFSTQKNDVQLNEIAKQYLNFNTNLDLRLGTFDQDTWYYFRVFGYNRPNDRGYENIYGSKIIKWKYSGAGKVESSIEEPNDPVIVQSTTSTSSEPNNYEFGVLRATAFDTIVRFFWSDPNLTNNEYDNTLLVISEKSDLSDPVLEAKIDRNLLKARIDGLKPSTQYHIAGYFEKDGRRFGKSNTIKVQTYDQLDASGKARLQRRMKLIGINEGFGVIINAQQYDDNEVAKSEEDTTTSTSSSTSTSTSTTSRSRFTKSTRSSYTAPNNASDINNELRRIRAEMGVLQQQRMKNILKLREIQS